MNLLFRIVYASSCRSTHHKLAMDALPRLQATRVSDWQELFLAQHKAYLRGAKDPDDKFRDFKNHVLHVEENYWGGPVEAAKKWYQIAVDSFKKGDWEHGVYACGVVSHYFTDPIMPFHTGQSDKEANIHRAAEWSITKSYDELIRNVNATHGMASVKSPVGDDWLKEMIHRGAEAGHAHYFDFLNNYNFTKGVQDPPAGLNQFCRDFLAKLLGMAVAGWSIVLSKIIQDANVSPPNVNLTAATLIAGLESPIQYVVKKIADAQEREYVIAMYEEFVQTGKVEKNLPEDDRVVRELHQVEVVEPNRIREEQKAMQLAKEQESRIGGSSTSLPQRPSLLRSPLTSRLGSKSPAPSTKPTVGPRARLRPGRKLPSSTSSPSTSTAKPTVTPPTVRPASPTTTPRVPKAEESIRTPFTSMKSNPEKTEGAEKSPPRTLDLTPKTNVNRAAPTVEREDVKPIREPAFEQKTQRPEPIPPKPIIPMSTKETEERVVERANERTNDSVRESRPSESSKSQKREKRFYLEVDSDIEAAPSIGPKTAKRLEKVGVRTVADLFEADPETLAMELGAKHIMPDTIIDWQDQSKLMCAIPGLRGHDSQLLVACGYREPVAVARANANRLLQEVQAFASTSQGQSIIRSGDIPDAEEVRDWIQSASQARSLRAA